MRSFGKFGLLLGLVLVLGAGWALSQRQVGRGQAQVPAGLAIARRSAGGVDVVGWDGSGWDALLAEGRLTALTEGGHSYSPEIQQVLPSPTGARLALAVGYCSAEIAQGSEPAHPCLMGGRAFIYDRAADVLQPLQRSPTEPLLPFRWQDEQTLLVSEGDALTLLRYTVGSGALTPLAIPDGDIVLPATSDGMTADGALLAYSAEDAERIWQEGAATSQVVPGGPSDHNAVWLSFSRQQPGSQARLALVAPTLATALGAGALRIFEPATGAVTQVPATSALAFDHSPAWAESERLAFLRGDGDSWQPGLFGESSERMPAALMTFDLASGAQSEILPADAVRRALAAPHQAGTLVFLRSEGDGPTKVYGLRLAGGGEYPLLSDDRSHTAFGWSE